MTLAEHLKHLLWLMEPPFTEAFKGHCWQRAQDIAMDPEMADLPSLLTAEMQKRSNRNIPTPKSTDEPRSN
jgi:hypothetical protein